MDIYNEEKAFGKVIIVADRAEAKQLIQALRTAVEANKRRIIWRKLLKTLIDKAHIW